MIAVILTKERFGVKVVPGETIADLRKRIAEDLNDKTQGRPFTMKVQGLTCSDGQRVDAFFPSTATAVHIKLKGKKPQAPASSGPVVCKSCNSAQRVGDL